jgi:hypothetical protein
MTEAPTDGVAPDERAPAQEQPRGPNWERNQLRKQRAKAAKAKKAAEKTAKSNSKETAKQSSFVGNEPKMNGRVLQTPEECSETRQMSLFVEELQSYSDKNMKDPMDMRPLFLEFKRPEVTKPDPKKYDAKDEFEMAEYKLEMSDYIRRRNQLDSNLAHLFTVIWGQLSVPLKAKLEAKEEEFKEAKEKNSCEWLLSEAKKVRTKFENKSDPFLAGIDAMIELLLLVQGPHEELVHFMNRISEHIKTMTENQLEILGGERLENHVKKHDAKADVKKAIRDRVGAMIFLMGLDTKKYPDALVEVQKKAALQTTEKDAKDPFPKNLGEALDLVLQFIRDGIRPNGGEEDHQGPRRLHMVQRDEDTVTGSDGVTHESIECRKCKMMGHYASQCPRQTGRPINLLQYQLALRRYDEFSDLLLVLDSASSITVISNPNYVRNIRRAKEGTEVQVNGNSTFKVE